MKKALVLALFVLFALPMVAQSGNKKPGINKENCTFTNKDGKTFNLYGIRTSKCRLWIPLRTSMSRLSSIFLTSVAK